MTAETDYADALDHLRNILLRREFRSPSDPVMRLVDAAISERQLLRNELARAQHPAGKPLEDIVDPQADLGAKRRITATLRLTVLDGWQDYMAGGAWMKDVDRVAMELGQRLAGCPAWTITDVRVGKS